MYANKRNVAGGQAGKFNCFVEKFHLQPTVASDMIKSIQKDTKQQFNLLQPGEPMENGEDSRWDEEESDDSQFSDIEEEDATPRDMFWQQLTGKVQSLVAKESASDLEKYMVKSEDVPLADQRQAILSLLELAHGTVENPEDTTLPEPCQEVLKLAKCFLKEFLCMFKDQCLADGEVKAIFKGVLELRMNNMLKDDIYERCRKIHALNENLIKFPYRRALIFEEMEDLMLDLLLPMLKKIVYSANANTPKDSLPATVLQVKVHELEDCIDGFQNYLKIKDSATSSGSSGAGKYTIEDVKQPQTQQGSDADCSVYYEEEPEGSEWFYSDDDQPHEQDEPLKLVYEIKYGMRRIKIGHSKNSSKYRKTLKNIQRYLETRRMIDETIRKMKEDNEIADKLKTFQYDQLLANLMVLTIYGMEAEVAVFMLAEFGNQLDLVIEYVKGPELIT